MPSLLSQQFIITHFFYRSYMVKSMFLSKEMLFHNLGTNYLKRNILANGTSLRVNRTDMFVWKRWHHIPSQKNKKNTTTTTESCLYKMVKIRNNIKMNSHIADLLRGCIGEQALHWRVYTDVHWNANLGKYNNKLASVCSHHKQRQGTEKQTLSH